MLLDMDPGVYGLYLTTNRKGINKLVTQCMDAIYGAMVKNLLYSWNFCKTSTLNKFKINPYDPCVANQMVNGLQQSILFHVDYCKLSHNYPNVNGSFSVVIHEEYQSIFEDGSGTM